MRHGGRYDWYFDVDFSNRFYYDESSPSCLRWKHDVLSGRGYSKTLVHAGDIAGSVSVNCRYWTTRLSKKSHSIHRIVLSLFRVEVPSGFVVDHINGNSKDNRIENLRVVSRKENCRNLRMSVANTSGRTGVRFHWRKERADLVYAKVTWYNEAGRACVKYFSSLKLGLMPAWAAACAFRDAVMTLAQTPYTERHGK